MLKAVIFSALAMTSPAVAATNCGGNDHLLVATSWAIEPIDGTTNKLTVTVENAGNRSIKMLDASVGFTDILGGYIAGYAMDRDATIPAAGTFEETGRWGAYTFERLLNLAPDEVSVTVCVKAVLYADGTKEEFTAPPPEPDSSLADEIGKIINP